MSTTSALKKVFYESASSLFLGAGADRVIRRRNQKRRLVIMYHGVARRDHSEFNGRNLPVKQFEKQLQYFKANFEIVPLRNLGYPGSFDSPSRRPGIALTFDDGLENNFLNVLPLLEKYKVPATFFIPGIAVDNEHYILSAEIIEIIRARTKERSLYFGNDHFVKRGKYGLLRETDGLTAHKCMIQLRPHERNETLRVFAEQYHLKEILAGVDKECWKLMNANQIRQMSNSQWVEIGSHSQEHYSLVHLSDQEAEHELKVSKQLLEDCTKKNIETLAYPFGAYDERIKMLSKKSGYNNLLAAGTLKYDDEDILPRVGLKNGASFASNMLWVNRSFNQFGF